MFVLTPGGDQFIKTEVEEGDCFKIVNGTLTKIVYNPLDITERLPTFLHDKSYRGIKPSTEGTTFTMSAEDCVFDIESPTKYDEWLAEKIPVVKPQLSRLVDFIEQCRDVQIIDDRLCTRYNGLIFKIKTLHFTAQQIGDFLVTKGWKRTTNHIHHPDYKVEPTPVDYDTFDFSEYIVSKLTEPDEKPTSGYTTLEDSRKTPMVKRRP